jgi:hypothetical protein
MTRVVAFLAVVGCGGALVGDGDVREEDRTTPSFRSVSVEGPIAGTLTAGADARVLVRADANLLDHLVTEVTGSTLFLRVDAAVEEGTLEVEVSATSFEGIYHDGSKLIEAFDLASPGLEVVGSGTGRLVGHGAIGSSEVVTAGTCEVDLGDLETGRVHLEHKSSGLLTVWATEAVDGILTGSGDLIVKGSPPEQDVADEGTGSITYE